MLDFPVLFIFGFLLYVHYVKTHTKNKNSGKENGKTKAVVEILGRKMQICESLYNHFTSIYQIYGCVVCMLYVCMSIYKRNV